MQIFLDSANYREIEYWLRQGVIDGVTTNPSIMLKDGAYDIEDCARRLCTLLGNHPVSVEVTTNEIATMLEQGRTFARWAPNIVVKIPVVNEYGESCLGVVHTLSSEGHSCQYHHHSLLQSSHSGRESGRYVREHFCRARGRRRKRPERRDSACAPVAR